MWRRLFFIGIIFLSCWTLSLQAAEIAPVDPWGSSGEGRAVLFEGRFFSGPPRMPGSLTLNGADLSPLAAEGCAVDSRALDRFIRDRVSLDGIPGLAACVVKDGEVIWTGAYRYANYGENRRVTDSTNFMLASVSKTVTAVALMQLYDRGLFGLDDDINDYLPFPVSNPNFPGVPITFRHLLTHTSGIMDNWGVMLSHYVLGDSPIPLGDFLEDYLTPGGAYYDPDRNFHDWAPGTGWDYCNIAVALAGYLVEAIRGNTTFDRHCNEFIFAPLGMDHTAWFLSDLDIDNVAMPYFYTGSNFIPYGHYGYPDYPDGQLRTSTLELARFLIMFMQGGEIDGVRILEASTVQEMTSIQFPDLDPDQGLIWYRFDLLGRMLWGHDGGDFGVSTLMYYSPAENTGVIILTNGEEYIPLLYIMHHLFEFAEGYVPVRAVR